ncbi:MAG: hypothetical protein RQ731_09545 [Anaerosomatales bacterium]|nr:hypothetical protein [Anaerosomatales bacterium]
MSKRFPDLLNLVERELVNGVPDQDPITWVPATWHKRFPAGSLAGRYLDELDGQPLSRSAILDVAGRIPNLSEVDRAFEVERLFLLSQVWGYGTVGYGAFRTAAIMRGTPFISVVGRVYEELIEHGAVAAYHAMRRGGPENLRGLGPAFATKFLHFAGYGVVPPGTPEPLILDSLVGAALHKGEPTAFGPFTGRVWDSETYCRYLDAVDWVCANTAIDGLRPADTELALFLIGKAR